jgi:hypothetical protein
VKQVEFLESWLTILMLKAPQNREEKPEEVFIAPEGKIASHPNPKATHEINVIEHPDYLSAQIMIQELLRHLRDAEEEDRRLQARLQEAKERLDDTEKQRFEEIKEGRSATRWMRLRNYMGLRGWRRGGLAVFIGLLLLLEVVQFFYPAFNIMGVDAGQFLREWHRSPILVGLGVAISIGVASLLFFAAHHLIELGISIYKGDEPWDKLKIKVIWGLFILFGILVLCFCVGMWRAQTTSVVVDINSSDGPPVHRIDYGAIVLVLITMFTPFAGGLLIREFLKGQEDSGDADQVKIDNRAKYNELRREARKSEKKIRRQKARTSREVSRLQAAEHENQMIVRENIETDRQENRQFIQELKSALEKLRFAFIMAARKRAPHLLAPPSREAAEA